MKSIAKTKPSHYSELVAWVNAEKIRTVLAAEVPEFRISRSFGAVLGVLVAFLLSVSLSACVGVGIGWFLTALMHVHFSGPVVIAAAVGTPILGFLVGYLSRDSLVSPGSQIVEHAVTRETSNFGFGYSNDDRSNDMMTGCFIFLLQTLAGSVYATGSHLAQLAGPSHESERELAVSIVNHLLVEGRTPTDKLASALEEQGVSKERTRSTVVLLRKAAVLEPGPDDLAIAPHKRHLFGA